MISRC